MSIKQKKKKIKIKTEPIELVEEKEKENKTMTIKDKWLELEGELPIDLFENQGNLVIQTPIAGVRAKDLDISIENDVLTIKGGREQKYSIKDKDYFYQECFWGDFSRKIILPKEIDPNHVEAIMKDNILTIKIPVIHKQRKKKITIK